MGLEIEHVLSDPRHHGAFVCAICHNLVDLDALVTTKCSHVFCPSCLSTWLERSHNNCPTCNTNVLYSEQQNHQQKQMNSPLPLHMMMGSRCVMVQPLQSTQPLAHRVVKTILVKCPLDGVTCSWKGDYGDLQSHLTSPTAHLEDDDEEKTNTITSNGDVARNDSDNAASSKQVSEATVERIYKLSTSLKEQANSQFASGHFNEAESLYTKAISVLEQNNRNGKLKEAEKTQQLLATLYCNRAATHLQLVCYSECINDCRQSFTIDPTYVKAYVRICRAYLQEGKFSAACDCLVQGIQVNKKAKILEKELQKARSLSELYDKGIQQLASGEYASAKSTFSNLMRESSSGAPVLIGAANADLGMGLTESALTLTMRVLQRNPQNPEACLVRGEVMFLMGDSEVGLKWMQQALRLDPDSQTIKNKYKQSKQAQQLLEDSRKKHFCRDFKEAVNLLTQAIQKCEGLPPKSPLYATMYTQRAEYFLRLKQYKEALQDCAKVVYAQEGYVAAWLIRFKAQHGLGEHETAREEIRELLQKLGNTDEQLQKAYENADFLVRKSKRPDFYKLLGISCLASDVEIKKAYKRKALELHPDKAPQDKQEEAQRNFQALGEALEILTDTFKRKLYDEGYDMESIRERVEAANQAAHRHQHHRGFY